MDTEKSGLAEVVQSAQNGDAGALETLYIEYSKRVYYLALKILRNETDAEDVMGEVFVTVCEKLADLKEPANFSKWLNRVTVNKCTDAFRRKGNRVIIPNNLGEEFNDEELDYLNALEETNPLYIPDKALDNAETAQMLIDIVDTLPDVQRMCIYYYYYEQLTVAQIAEALETNDNSIKGRLHLARKKIRKELERLEEKEGLKLYSLIPLSLTPAFKLVLEHYEMSADILQTVWSDVIAVTALNAATVATAATAATAATTTVTTATATATTAATAATATTVAATTTAATVTTTTVATTGVIAAIKANIALVAAGVVIAGGVTTGVIIATSDDVYSPVPTDDKAKASVTTTNTGDDAPQIVINPPHSPGSPVSPDRTEPTRDGDDETHELTEPPDDTEPYDESITGDITTPTHDPAQDSTQPVSEPPAHNTSTGAPTTNTPTTARPTAPPTTQTPRNPNCIAKVCDKYGSCGICHPLSICPAPDWGCDFCKQRRSDEEAVAIAATDALMKSAAYAAMKCWERSDAIWALWRELATKGTDEFPYGIVNLEISHIDFDGTGHTGALDCTLCK
ncbi:MAG: sigma-70 family RNA polymerase sigma factor [Oscillospiraceae bacterium]|nr:sigma-70 family RNA polymerase sigma factor [Oscillospiraceae bacterium]